MIMAEDTPAREAALAKMLPFQRNDFAGLFRAMAGRPVTIRLLDPPLHEFLPHDHAGQEEMAKILGKPVDGDRPPRRTSCTRRTRCSAIAAAGSASSIRRSRPCRRGRSSRRPCEVKKDGIAVNPEVMIPLVGFKKESRQPGEDRPRARRPRCSRETGVTRRVPGRHDDRGAAGVRRRPTRSPRRPSSSASAPTT